MPETSDPVLEVRDLRVAFGPRPILRGASFAVCPNECLTLLGANGSGKSTALNAICGLVPPRAGSVKFAGAELAGLPPHRIFALGIACNKVRACSH